MREEARVHVIQAIAKKFQKSNHRLFLLYTLWHKLSPIANLPRNRTESAEDGVFTYPGRSHWVAND